MATSKVISSYQEAILIVLQRHGDDGVYAVDLFREVAKLIGEPINAHFVCSELGYEPDDLLALATV
jgi:hypothetical protein